MSMVVTQRNSSSKAASGPVLRSSGILSQSMLMLWRRSCSRRNVSVPARSAGIADVLVPLGNLVQIPRQGAAGREKVHLEDEMATARVILDHVLQRRIGYQAAVPIVLSVDFHGGKAWRQSAAREDVLW